GTTLGVGEDDGAWAGERALHGGPGLAVLTFLRAHPGLDQAAGPPADAAAPPPGGRADVHRLGPALQEGLGGGQLLRRRGRRGRVDVRAAGGRDRRGERWLLLAPGIGCLRPAPLLRPALGRRVLRRRDALRAPSRLAVPLWARRAYGRSRL